MSKNEGHSTSAERRVDPLERRPLIVDEAVDSLLLPALETRNGHEVPDTPEDRKRVYDQEVRARLAAAVNFIPTPQNLAQGRQIEFGEAPPVPSIPISGEVDFSVEPFPAIHQSGDLTNYTDTDVIIAAEQIAQDVAMQPSQPNQSQGNFGLAG